jgi:hypothetical protein
MTTNAPNQALQQAVPGVTGCAGSSRLGLQAEREPPDLLLRDASFFDS